MGPKAHGMTVEVSSANFDVTLSLVGKHGGEVGSVIVSFERFKEVVVDILEQARVIDEAKPKLRLVRNASE